jgi:hypothetical protein
MVDVVLARQPALTVVRVIGAFVGALYKLPVRRSQVLGEAEKL